MSRKLILVGATLLASIGPCFAQTATPAAGHWEGRIDMGTRQLGIVVDLARTAGGGWVGSMTVPGTTSVDVPLANLAVDGSVVRFSATLPERASFEGSLSPDAATLAGTASNAAGSAPFQLARKGDPAVKLAPPSSPLSKDFEGTWEATLTSGGQTRRFALRLSRAADGTAVGTLIAVDQGQEIPASTVAIVGKQIDVESRAISGAFHGTLGADDQITGEWTQGAQHLSLTFARKR